MAYETTTCTRCAGSGHYSYNQMTGTRCFKCHGSGAQLTKRGIAARAYADTLLNINPTDLKAGHVVRIGAKGQLTVISTQIVESGVRSKDQLTGEWVPVMQVEATGPKFTKTFSLGDTLRLFPTVEQLQEISDYQDSLTKAGTVRKNKS